MSVFNALILIFLVAIPLYSKAEAWEVTTEKTSKYPRYYAGEGYGYYRRVPDKEIYYAPNIYVSTDGKKYYYQMAKLKSGEKVYLPYTAEEVENVSSQPAPKHDVKYKVSLVYVPKGLSQEYLYKPLKNEIAPLDVKKGGASIYPLYFD